MYCLLNYLPSLIAASRVIDILRKGTLESLLWLKFGRDEELKSRERKTKTGL